MVQTVSSKWGRIVRKTLDHFLIDRKGLGQRYLMRFETLAWSAQQKDRLASVLVRLHQLAIPVTSVVIPKGLRVDQIDPMLDQLKNVPAVVELLGHRSVLDLRKLGLVVAGVEAETIKLFGGNVYRTMISQESEANLLELAMRQPFQVRRLLDCLRGTTQAVAKIVVPQLVLEPQNRAAVRFLADGARVASLIDEGGILDLRRLGLREGLGYIDLTPKYNRPTLDDYRAILTGSVSEFAKNREYGNLFIFKALLKVRTQLYEAGSERSARRDAGQAIGMTPKLQEVKEFLEFVVATFPFGNEANRIYLRTQFSRAAALIDDHFNYPAADVTLAPLTDRLGSVLQEQLVSRLKASRRGRGWKVASDTRKFGEWIVVQYDHRRTTAGLRKKEPVEHSVTTAKVLSMLQHEIDSIGTEVVRNEQFIADLQMLEQLLPDRWDQLFEIFLQFTKFYALHKDKAAIELEAALQLVVIGSPQAISLGKALVYLAIRDMGLRQEEIKAQQARFVEIKAEVEEQIGKKLVVFEREMGARLASPKIFDDKAVVDRLDQRLGQLLGSYFKDVLREDWLGVAKSKLYGLKRGLPKIKRLVEDRRRIMASVVGIRQSYDVEKEALQGQRLAADRYAAKIRELQGASLQRVTAALQELKKVTDELALALDKAQKHILTMSLAYNDRHKGEGVPKTTAESHLAIYPEICAALRLQFDFVMAVDKSSRPLGQILRRDACELSLTFVEIAPES